MCATRQSNAAKPLALFLVAYLAYAVMMWLPDLVNFEPTQLGLTVYASLTLLPMLAMLGLYVSIYRREDEFFRHLTLVSTSVAFLLAGFLGLVIITFARFGMGPPPGATTFNILVISWLVSYSFFLFRGR